MFKCCICQKVKSFGVIILLWLLSVKGAAQEDSLWKSIDSIDIKSAYSLFSDIENNSVEGIWESRNGVVFMIKECCDKEGAINYQMIMLEDKVVYGDWHIKVDCGKVIGLLYKTADKSIYGCKFKRYNNSVVSQFHLSLKDNRLVYTADSNLRRKLFGVKIFPLEKEKKKKDLPRTSPLSETVIEKEVF